MAIYEAIEKTIKENKGEVRFGSPVEQVVVEKGKVDGVKLKDGTAIKAKVVISTVGAHPTFCNIVPRSTPLLQEAYDELTSGKAPMSSSAYMLCIVLKPDQDYPKQFFYHMEPGKTPVYISFMSSRDPKYADRNPDTRTCEISCRFLPEDIIGLSEEAVNAKVESTREMLLGVFKLHFPEYADSIIDSYPLTPLKMQEELGSYHGSLYGMAQVPSRLTKKWLNTKSPLPGLYLGGQVCVLFSQRHRI